MRAANGTVDNNYTSLFPQHFCLEMKMSLNLPVNKSIWIFIWQGDENQSAASSAYSFTAWWKHGFEVTALQTLHYLWRGKNNKYTLIFMFVKTTIISSWGKAEKTADVSTNPFPYLLTTKIKRLCLEEFKQHLFPATRYRSRHCLTILPWTG